MNGFSVELTHGNAQVLMVDGNVVDLNTVKDYLQAAYEMQDLLSSNDSGIVINGLKSEPAAIRKVQELSETMWESRKLLTPVKEM